MSDDILRKKEAVKAAYPGPKWSEKVDKMSEGQIIAVFMRLKKQNKI